MIDPFNIEARAEILRRAHIELAKLERQAATSVLDRALLDGLIRMARDQGRRILLDLIHDTGRALARVAFGPALWDARAVVDHDPGDEDAEP